MTRTLTEEQQVDLADLYNALEETPSAKLTDQLLEGWYEQGLKAAGREDEVDSLTQWLAMADIAADERAFGEAWERAYERMHAHADAERKAKAEPSEDDLMSEFEAWMTAQQLSGGDDAHSYLMRDDITPEQRRWLSDFVIRWDAMEARRKAEA